MIIKRPKRIFYKKNKFPYIIIHGKKKYLSSINPEYIKKIFKKYYKKGKKKITKNIKKKKKQINNFLSGEIHWKISGLSNIIDQKLNKEIIQKINDDIQKKNINLPIDNEIKNLELVEYKKNDNMDEKQIDKFLLWITKRLNDIREYGINEINKIKEKQNKSLEEYENDKKKYNELNEKLKEETEKLYNIEKSYKNLIWKYAEKKKDVIEEKIKNITLVNMKKILDENKIKYKTSLKKDDLSNFIKQNHPKIWSELIGVEETIIEGEENKEEIGEGKKNNDFSDGLTIDEIDNIMKPFKYYIKTILQDEINIIIDIVFINKMKKFGFILLNLNKSDSKKKIGHYIAIYVDIINDMWCEIFDPLGKNNLWNKLINLIKDLLNKLKIDYYLKLKINLIAQQSKLSSSCGWFCIRFLIQRFNNIPFKIATGYNKILKNEKDIEKIKQNYKIFGYI